jgi:hypothetical protein
VFTEAVVGVVSPGRAGLISQASSAYVGAAIALEPRVQGGTVVMYQAFRQQRTCTPTPSNCPLFWKLGSRRSKPLSNTAGDA